MNSKPTLSESLDRMAFLENKLKDLGVPQSAIPDVMGHIDEYVGLKEGLDQAREQQFRDDAYEIARQMSAASNKNIERLTGILRKFTLHVVEHTLNFASPKEQNDVQIIADHIPPFFSEEEED